MVEKTWGYEIAENSEEFTARYVDLLKQVWGISDLSGLSGVIYTQLSDVETECNGLLTYDRAVVKLDMKTALSVNLGKLREERSTVLVPTANHGRTLWRYTLAKPGPRWNRFGFGMGPWKLGQAGFGFPIDSKKTDTAWNTPQIWLQRQVCGCHRWIKFDHN